MIRKALRMGGILLACMALPARGTGNDQQQPKDNNEASTTQSSHRPHVRLGGIVLGAGYTRFSGPYYAYPYFYDPLFWPYYGLYAFHPPGFYGGFARGPNMGQIKLRPDQGKAEVYIDGAYAGTAQQLKSMWLEPGAYNLEVKAGQRLPFSKRIYVLSGKTLKLNVHLIPDQGERKP